MCKNLLFSAVVFVCLLPLTACASSLFKKSQAQTNPPVLSVPETANEQGDQSISMLLDGEWIITQVGSTKIEREEENPYIHFVGEDNSFYASNGCNILNGSYTVDGSRLTFHNVLSTMKYCADAPFDTHINAVLADEKPVIIEFENKHDEIYLYFCNSSGTKLMILHKPGLDFLNGNWEVEKINGEKFDTSDMTIFFDVEERKVHGNTGCNSFNGEIFVDAQNDKSFSLSNMAVTMRMCPNIDNQTKFLVALEMTTHARLTKSGQLELLNSKNDAVVVLKALPVKNNCRLSNFLA